MRCPPRGVLRFATNVMASSSQLRWLEQLHQVFTRVGVPAQDIVLAGEALHIDLASTPEHHLRVQVRPRRADRKGFATTRRFVVGYQGPGNLPAPVRRDLERLASVLARIESRLPELDGAGGYFVTTPPWEERFRRLFPCCTVERSRAGPETITEVMVRATSACNQKCPFCSAPDHEPPSPAVMRSLLREVPQAFPNAMLSLTGGEPTLRPTFPEELEIALQTPGIGHVQVQTNAVAFASKLDPSTIVPHRKLSFFVSLHALDEAVYDKCTGTAGQLPLATRGLVQLARSGHRVTVNCVLTSANVNHLPDYIRGLRKLLPPSDRADLHLSTLICPEWRPGVEAFLVPYTALVERLRNALAVAREVGLEVQSLRSSTHASMPPCLLDPEERDRDPHRPLVLDHETGSIDDGRPWVRAPACTRCVEVPHCLGVPRAYALRFGLDELRPIRGR